MTSSNFILAIVMLFIGMVIVFAFANYKED